MKESIRLPERAREMLTGDRLAALLDEFDVVWEVEEVARRVVYTDSRGAFARRLVQATSGFFGEYESEQGWRRFDSHATSALIRRAYEEALDELENIREHDARADVIPFTRSKEDLARGYEHQAAGSLVTYSVVALRPFLVDGVVLDPAAARNFRVSNFRVYRDAVLLSNGQIPGEILGEKPCECGRPGLVLSLRGPVAFAGMTLSIDVENIDCAAHLLHGAFVGRYLEPGELAETAHRGRPNHGLIRSEERARILRLVDYFIDDFGGDQTEFLRRVNAGEDVPA
jgi:hypothetical protein